MPNLSLRLRSLLIAILALGIFIPVTVLTLSKAYTSSLLQAKYSELKLMNLAMISVFEFDDGVSQMPDMLYDEQLNLPDSGYLGAITINNELVWQSASSVYTVFDPQTSTPATGDENFVTQFAFENSDGEYFAYSFTAEFDDGERYIPVSFYVYNDRQDFLQERDAFLRSVWQYLGALGAGLLVVLILGMNTLLKPVRLLIGEIQQASGGNQTRLMEDYPPEFTPLKQSINQLLAGEAEQRERYKNSLGDLAHSLKTPLAVAMGTSSLPESAREPLQQIDALIKRQLKRASAGASAWSQGVPVMPVAEQLIAALNKVYRDKALQLKASGDEGVFFGDKTDLMEILGNLMDNACKAARHQVVVSVKQLSRQTELCIDDDGPGIPAEQVERLLNRGQRLDAYTDGQGIGMAVVTDLLTAYEGKLSIERSASGGASIRVTLPAPR
ncbi:ATP-binding protein [uncultured Alteromonas sp.]|jgi:two-component system sensor histidine kinase PhoQ|uniref:ATP-binding protein n=1 Tax=uncultured Alteromonas sp. TaxID=179113 RepID=UPI0025D1F516|nr:ATP-binding protein [uncultured Alteromonas sp.]